MYSRYRLMISMIAALLLMSTPVNAGWGDTLKQAGTQYANDQASDSGLSYTPAEVTTGIKEVLSLGTKSALSSLSSSGGFMNNPAVAIGLPDSLKSLGGNDLLTSLNKAADEATPATGNIILNAIQKLSINDPMSLLGGGDNVITQFFEKTSRESIKTLIKPVVSQAVDSAGVGSYLNAMMLTQQAAGLTGTTFDPYDYVADKTLDGFFYFMGMKEKDIRSTGGVGTTDLLKKLF